MLDYLGHCVFLVYIKTGSEHVTQDRNKHSRMKGHLCDLAREVGELTVGLRYVPNQGIRLARRLHSIGF